MHYQKNKPKHKFHMITKLVKYDFNNSASLNASASKATTSAVIVGTL